MNGVPSTGSASHLALPGRVRTRAFMRAAAATRAAGDMFWAANMTLREGATAYVSGFSRVITDSHPGRPFKEKGARPTGRAWA